MPGDKPKRVTAASREGKGKLTLSVGPKYVAMLRKAGARRGRSITELVKDLAVALDAAGPDGDPGKTLWVDRVNRRFAGCFRDKDYDRDDLVGALLRKHLPRSQGRP